MVFSSYLFLFFFLPVALGLYYVLPRWGKHLALTVVSYVFYGWANPWFVLLLAASTAINYFCGLAMADRLALGRWSQPIEILPRGTSRSATQKWALFIAVATNLGALGYYKYFNLVVDSYNTIADLALGAAFTTEAFKRVVLPLGISFYTFQAMSYSIDVYRGDAKAIRNPINFACYVAMFPQLVAGPIIRFSEVAEQLEHRTHTYEKFARGVALFSFGMAKKILLANPCGWVADQCFNAETVHTIDAWYGATSYAFQIYFDFSGYSDMAIGLGLMMGFVFPKNFDSPYKSASITEFWRRWHLSLSSWLRDYLYIPLGGNRHGEARTYVNLMLVMLLGGLWHGASSWNFVIWGAIHGVMLSIERAAGGKDALYRFLPRPGRVAVTFLLTLFAWVFFRAADGSRAIEYLGCMFGLVELHEGAGVISDMIYRPNYVFHFLVAAGITWFGVQSWDWTRRIDAIKTAICLLLLAYSTLVLFTQSYNPFIYFIF